MARIKGKALKRALQTKDAYRINNNVPLISDTTEFITPEKAEEMLRRNKMNRPVNWNKVEQYKTQMENGEWKLHAQGIILDNKSNILTGQMRLWAIIYSGKGQYMRISRGSPPETARFIDRGTSQSSRDLASRQTERKHSPTEASIIRAMMALNGNIKPTVDDISYGLVENSEILKSIIEKTKRVKKTKAVLMILGAICSLQDDSLCGEVYELTNQFELDLAPTEVGRCWNRGAAFTLAMSKALNIVKNRSNQ